MAVMSLSEFTDLVDMAMQEVLVDKLNLYNDYQKYMDVRDMGSKASIKASFVSSLGQLNELAENAAINYDQLKQGYDKTFTPVKYGGGVRFSLELAEDDQFDVVDDIGNMLMDSAAYTNEQICANILIRAQNASYTGPDGKVLAATDHPLVYSGGTEGNRPTNNVDLTYTEFWNAVVDFENTLNHAGLTSRQQVRRLIVGPYWEEKATQILGNPDQPDTTVRNINALIKNRKIQLVVVHNIPADNKLWALQGDNHTLRLYWKKRPVTDSDGDFDTSAVKTKVLMRLVTGWIDWHGIWVSAGA